MKRFLLFLIGHFILAIGLLAEEPPTNERLDNSFGFREFKLKTPREKYNNYDMKRTNFYKLPDIIQVYEIPYELGIGNTSMVELHLFFLGNQLVRVTAMLKDSLSLAYLKKSFGPGYPPEVTVKLDKKLMDDIANGVVSFAYKPVWAWKAETVRFEEKWIFLCDEGSCVQRMCLDMYLVDFQDLMESILN